MAVDYLIVLPSGEFRTLLSRGGPVLGADGSRVIAHMDGLSRIRALDAGESKQLQKMIAMERRYAAMAEANARSKPRVCAATCSRRRRCRSSSANIISTPIAGAGRQAAPDARPSAG